jgi:hypothetical protein
MMHGNNRKYETADVDSRVVLYFGVLLIVSAVVMHVGLWLLFRFFIQRDAQADNLPTRVGIQQMLPPEPRLQITPGMDYSARMQRETEQLNSYGWVDPRGGIARIPIDRAMDIIAAEASPAGRREASK